MKKTLTTFLLALLCNIFAGCLCFRVVSESSPDNISKMEIKYATVFLYFPAGTNAGSQAYTIYLYDSSPNKRYRELRERRIKARQKNKLQHGLTPLEEIDEVEYANWIDEQYAKNPDYYKKLEEAQKHKYDFLDKKKRGS
jgi:hypothetical protein